MPVRVVGAGSSGATLASDLAKRLPHASVLLIEAGGTNQFFKVRSPFITCPTLQNSELDWCVALLYCGMCGWAPRR